MANIYASKKKIVLSSSWKALNDCLSSTTTVYFLHTKRRVVFAIYRSWLNYSRCRLLAKHQPVLMPAVKSMTVVLYFLCGWWWCRSTRSPSMWRCVSPIVLSYRSQLLVLTLYSKKMSLIWGIRYKFPRHAWPFCLKYYHDIKKWISFQAIQ